MKLKNSFFYTLRQAPKDEESDSAILLTRAGFIKKTSAGDYMFMPLGHKVKRNIENIIREEMDNIDSQELVMPCLLPEDVYISSGRRANFGSSMFALKDRGGKQMVLGPTHEELFAMAAAMKINSYKDLPLSLYQIQTKFRDEARPRFGLIRVKEFVMKDAYTFDKDLAGLDLSYQKMFEAYHRIFTRLHVNYKVVRADTGVMGGLLSEEFQAISPIGEDTLVLCDKCDFSSNIEITQHIVDQKDDSQPEELQLVETPGCKSIEEVCQLLQMPLSKAVKALLMNVDEKLVVFFIKGDRQLNETKALKLLKAKELGFANDQLIATSNAVSGFTGPIGLEATIVIDEEVLQMKNFIVGANKENYHYINANVTDFKYDIVGDIVNVKENDQCPCCGGRLYFTKGIEVGNTFKLGTKYSQAMNLNYQDASGKLQPVYMGSYGIGVGRVMAAIAEQNHDENGLIWPINIAPYKVCIVIANTKDQTQLDLANRIYDNLVSEGIEPLLDDRDERVGVKFKDMELIGIPIRITVGRDAVNNQVEYILRTESEKQLISWQQAIENVVQLAQEK
ncbi:MAG: proline--tRNA ligase [Erysipelotrichaceae bacterium]